jgi:N-acetyl-alpha-D-glucosaminyl L-malate synthase BshA
MVEVIEFQGLDILHVHYAIPHAASAYLAKQMLREKKFKIITTLHGTDITLLGSDPSFFQITKFSIDQSDGVTAVSNFLKQETIKVFNSQKAIEVIPNFIPFSISIPKNRKAIRRRLATQDEFIITHISNFRPLKRVTDIVPIAKIVNEKKKIKVLMVGDGPERYKTEEQCRKEGLCDRILFLGKQENIQEILSISDVVLLPSATESFGLVALEAMAYGVPCVSSNAGGLTEVNQHIETGFTIEVGDIDSFAKAILTILSDRTLAASMGQKGKEYAQRNFNSDIIIPKYINFYKKTLGE